MNTNQTMVKMVLDRWFALIERFEGLLNTVTDKQLQNEIAPGRNRGIYLLGHLIAVHDDMLPLLNFGEKLFPELKKAFIESPDKAVAEIPAAKELRANWTKLNDVLTQKIKALDTDEWFQKHSAVSAEDFAKEPHRNRLNIMLTRATHLSYHNGQFVWIK